MNDDESSNRAKLNPMDPFEFSEYKTKLKQVIKKNINKYLLYLILFLNHLNSELIKKNNYIYSKEKSQMKDYH